MKTIKQLFDVFQNVSLTITFQHNVTKNADWHEHKTNTHYTLWLVTSGNIVVKTNDSTINANVHDVILFYPGESYHAHTDSENCSFIFLFFELGTTNMIDVFQNRNASGLYSGKMLNKQAASFQKNYTKRKRMADNSILSSLSDFMQLINTMFTAADFTPFKITKQINISQEITQTLIYINEHCTENISIKELAIHSGMSEKYFISKFNYNAGISPKQYQIKCRMQLAANMLINSSKTIAQISEYIGYPDQYSFSKAFRKYFGESPSSFRKRVQ